MKPIIIDFGVLEIGNWSFPLRIYGYGLMLVLGVLAAIFIARWLARRVGESPDVLTSCCVLSLIGGIVGSRIAYVIQHWRTHFANVPNQLGAILNLTSGGLIYYGGLVLAIVLVLGYLRLKKLPVRRYLDILAVCVMVGLAFGRAGCLLNGCCYGGSCRKDWALGMRFAMYSQPLIKLDGRENPFSVSTEAPSPVYAHQMTIGQIQPDPGLTDSAGRLVPPRDFTSQQIAIAEASRSQPVQPAQLLAIANALLIAALLIAFYRLRTREGQVFALMLMLYSITRFMLEGIRDSNPHKLSEGLLTHNQFTSIAMLGIGVAMMLLLRKLPASAGPACTERAAAGAQQAVVKLGTRSNRNRKR